MMAFTKKLSNSMEYTLWEPEQNIKTIAIYFHGGGFIYGTRKDIPSSLINIFLKNKIAIMSVDYPLAPNSSMDDILITAMSSFSEIYNLTIKPNNLKYILCGRSAGGYLMFYLTRQILNSNKFQNPEKIIDFYGYYDLDNIDKQNSFDTIISNNVIKEIDTTTKIHDDPAFSRYLYYVYLVSHNELLSAYQIDKNKINKYRISIDQLEKFPSIFSTASTSDKEVPFKYSKSLKKLSINNKFYPIYYLNHDFLKNIDNIQVKQMLSTLDAWL